MRKAGAHISRLVRAISMILGRELSLTESSEDSGSFVTIEARSSRKRRLAFRANEGTDLTASERELLRSALDLIRRETSASADYQLLRQKLRHLEVENAKLSIENRGLAEASSKDELTGLYNRFYVLDKIESELNRAMRHNGPTSLLMIDIDHFKSVNDSYGHRAGDEVLRNVGTVLRDCCRVYDVPGRYGGEEFFVLLPETKIDNTCTVAERIRHRLEGTDFKVPEARISVTASIGVAAAEESSGEGVWSAAALVERADRALYTAKRMGRNRIELWDPAQSGSFVMPAGH